MHSFLLLSPYCPYCQLFSSAIEQGRTTRPLLQLPQTLPRRHLTLLRSRRRPPLLLLRSNLLMAAMALAAEA